MLVFFLGVTVGALAIRFLDRKHDDTTSGGLLTRNARTTFLARAIFRTLDRLYEFGLEALVGHRFLRLSHRGRKTGRIYHTVVEVISYDPATRESIVLSGWGERGDWYRNIRATPALAIATAGEQYAPTQRFLDGAELYARLREYVRRNAFMAPLVRRTLGLKLDGSAADRAAFEAHGYRGVAFRPTQI